MSPPSHPSKNRPSCQVVNGIATYPKPMLTRKRRGTPAAAHRVNHRKRRALPSLWFAVLVQLTLKVNGLTEIGKAVAAEHAPRYLRNRLVRAASGMKGRHTSGSSWSVSSPPRVPSKCWKSALAIWCASDCDFAVRLPRDNKIYMWSDG